VSVRVRFAPSPTGSLHLGNALTAIANRGFADEHGGVLVLRIDDTDPERTVAGGEAGILGELAWLGVDYDEGPVRQSERGELYTEAARTALGAGAVHDKDGSVRLDGTTLLRPDGTATFQLASVADDLELGITHIIRGSDHRANEPIQRRVAAALGGELPELIHHGLLLGGDGRKLSKRHGHSSLAELREEGIPAAAVRAYLEELGLPRHDVRLDLGRLRRLATEAIAVMPDEELAAAAGAPVSATPALRGARTLVEAEAYARLVTAPQRVELPASAAPTLHRFVELRTRAPDRLDAAAAKEIVRELKSAGGDLRQLRLALTGASTGPELWAVVLAVPGDEAIARARAAQPGA
jgi:glutamyl/glutaminyl-tRNA synthetase